MSQRVEDSAVQGTTTDPQIFSTRRYFKFATLHAFVSVVWNGRQSHSGVMHPEDVVFADFVTHNELVPFIVTSESPVLEYMPSSPVSPHVTICSVHSGHCSIR